MDITEIGAGAGGGGILAALLTWAGFKSRLDSQDRRLDVYSKQLEGFVTSTQHDKECLLKLNPINDKLDKLAEAIDKNRELNQSTHDAIILMKANMHKRNGDL